ncbi:MAG: hypothetical protein K2G77_07815 [Muribaculaceae bacterium]|nr:hypothetical protein [Muribaculaceae bacterium]
MKRFLLFAIVSFLTLPIFADINGEGYYRVRNAFTKRYAYLMDDKGSYSAITTSADVAALELYADTKRVLSDPSTIFFIDPQGNDYYDICGQGTSIHSFLDLYVTILKDRSQYDGATTYSIYASNSGLVKYLGDIWDDLSNDKGLASVDTKGDARKWNILPIEVNGDEYFGVAPTVESGDKKYAPFFAAFPFSAYSEDVRFYTIYEIDSRGAAIVREVEGTVPASTPVIIECKSNVVSDNRLNIGGNADIVTDNKLKGVYFDNPLTFHYNRLPFDKESMRVLGVGKDGRLAFVKADYDFVPRNMAYLQLTDPSQYDTDEFLVLTAEQRDIEFSAVEAVEAIPSADSVDVYTLDGRILKQNMLKSDVPLLGKGLYILKGKGKSEKLIVR